MGSFDATVATAPVAVPLHGPLDTVAGLDHVVVDAGIGVAVGVVLVALYVVALRWTREEEEGESRPETARGGRRET